MTKKFRLSLRGPRVLEQTAASLFQNTLTTNLQRSTSTEIINDQQNYTFNLSSFWGQATPIDSVPLDIPDQRHCEAALGYCELGMFDDANAELQRVDAFNRTTPEVLRVRVAIYHGLEKWARYLP